MITFKVRCNPPKSTHQASARIMKRKDGSQFIGKPENSKGAAVRCTLTDLFKDHAPAKPLQGPLELRVNWCYAWRKSEPKKNRVNGWKWCDKRPDCDNLAKMVKDVLGDLGFYTDDAQVARLVFCKFWADVPHIKVSLVEMEGVGCG